jgi:hypothetical protein
MAVVTKTESKRGCGYRKPGFYFIMDADKAFGCGALPIAFAPCSCCGLSPNQGRGMQWLTTQYLKSVADKLDCNAGRKQCSKCQLSRIFDEHERVALDWVGAKSYPKPEVFIREAHRMGISRRINARLSKNGKLIMPLKDFELGRDIICLAHPHAAPVINNEGELKDLPGVFKIYKPQRLEMVVESENLDAEFIKNIEDQGITVVKVNRANEQQTFFK